MSLTPGYGETPVAPEDVDALTAGTRAVLGDEPTMAELYDYEQAILIEVRGALIEQIIDGRLGLEDLLADHFLRELHGRLYGDVWTWAGRFRTRELNLSVAPGQIAVELRSGLDTIRWRWNHTTDWMARVLGIAVHAETVRLTFRVHDLRHTGLTLYAQQGATLAELLHRGGHTDVSVALRYQHATSERDRALTKKLAAALG